MADTPALRLVGDEPLIQLVLGDGLSDAGFNNTIVDNSATASDALEAGGDFRRGRDRHQARSWTKRLGGRSPRAQTRTNHLTDPLAFRRPFQSTSK